MSRSVKFFERRGTRANYPLLRKKGCRAKDGEANDPEKFNCERYKMGVAVHRFQTILTSSLLFSSLLPISASI